MATGTRKSIGSVQRAIDILNLFDARTIELGITEIAAAQGLHKSTTAGLVYTLEQNGYLEQNPNNRKYRLGLRLLERAFVVLDQSDVRERALPFLQDLRNWCDESINLNRYLGLGKSSGKSLNRSHARSATGPRRTRKRARPSLAIRQPFPWSRSCPSLHQTAPFGKCERRWAEIKPITADWRTHCRVSSDERSEQHGGEVEST